MWWGGVLCARWNRGIPTALLSMNVPTSATRDPSRSRAESLARGEEWGGFRKLRVHTACAWGEDPGQTSRRLEPLQETWSRPTRRHATETLDAILQWVCLLRRTQTQYDLSCRNGKAMQSRCKAHRSNPIILLASDWLSRSQPPRW